MPKKVIWGLIASGLFLLLIIGLGLTTQIHQDETSHVLTTQKRPLIMIAGSSSRRTDFDDIVRSLNAQQRHPLITLTVTANQQLQFKEKRVENTNINDAIIVIFFENSADSAENIMTQTDGLAKAIQYLQRHQHLKTANALGYSNGGLIWSRYLAGLSTSKPLAIHDLMLIGTPFLGIDAEHPDKTLYTPLLKHKDQFKKLHAVINVAGDTGNGDDDIVPLSSVNAGGDLFMNNVTRYTAMTVNQKSISHGDLLHEAYVARLIRQNLINQ
ncbi:alpha/beta hydrolase [Lactiplantibacillus paraplantarum]|uniref:Alpha/beta hydrolase n=1 Tax=Lactiplantibacillus paraplantarum TaxID=60520 RepID=A0A098R2P5_9LACO|nr:alpha/beta hydrolase [Lactiplantibacillus paraplantarum]OAX76393.1 hydrolase [Lactiplantibacillus plantarum]ALO04937.1 hydrolase [Lactiplantibacillus paraplantarum]AVW11038.1 alpha/beta hydrolase [Lactiplantibacillus paraplantarum]AYJ39446.1 alpha/beta hydrolase [Lactiplantibacillus paraplantarum]ERL44920.1 putative cell surface hydrolase, membrane-bound (putative) [Lactiplantibacillus paraplantarum]